MTPRSKNQKSICLDSGTERELLTQRTSNSPVTLDKLLIKKMDQLMSFCYDLLLRSSASREIIRSTLPRIAPITTMKTPVNTLILLSVIYAHF